MPNIAIEFDRGTLRLDTPAALADRLPGVLWDERTECFRAPAHRYADLIEEAAALGAAVADAVRPGLQMPVELWQEPELRDYQRDALAAWGAFGRRGVVV